MSSEDKRIPGTLLAFFWEGGSFRDSGAQSYSFRKGGGAGADDQSTFLTILPVNSR
jgi:hypothetical protein